MKPKQKTSKASADGVVKAREADVYVTSAMQPGSNIAQT